MGFGIREPASSSGHHVPGTANLYDREGHVNENLEHERDKVIILHPQPSSSPNDPLNWPAWKKETTLLSICFASGISALMAPLFSPISGVLAKELHISFNAVAELSGYCVFMSAIGALISSAYCRLYGKRSIYLFSICLVFASTIWVIFATSFHSLLGARIVYGFGLGAFESLPVASVGDMYFIHQRGTRVTIFTLWILGCVNTAPIIGGYIAYIYGWRMMYKIAAGFVGLAMVLVFLICPETTYHRASVLETDVNSTDDLGHSGTKEHSGSEGGEAPTKISPSNSESAIAEVRRTWVQELAPFNGRHDPGNFFKFLARPFVCFLYPSVIFGFLLIGLFTAWDVGIAIVMAQIFAPPPALFNPAQLGYTFTFSAVASIAATLFGAYLVDNVSKWATLKNKKIFEPEFRLLLAVPSLMVGIPGIFGFGYYATSTPSPSWVVVSVLFGLVTFTFLMLATISYTYVLDCHRNYAVEMATGLLLLRNFFSYGASYFLPTWLQVDGTRTTLYALGGIECGVLLLCFSMYYLGKWGRDLVHRHSPLKALKLD